MRITKVHLQNFKRFTDLTIDQIPESAKLVLLIGANGSGKSSVFDALKFVGRPTSPFNTFSPPFYKKNEIDFSVNIISSDDRIFSYASAIKKKASSESDFKLIGRTSNRIVPKIRNKAELERIAFDGDAPETSIDEDTRFTNDVFMYMQNIDNALREPIFRGESADTLQIFKQSIEPLNNSLLNIFGGTNETTIQIAEYQNATPQATGKLIFRKGNSKINYDLLSHGEKQIVILLLNFIVRHEYYDDAIIFIDEMDVHLNTSLQYRLLEEIVKVWIPNNCQLWTASHALGFIDYAKKSEQAAIIDFDNLDFDTPQILLPQSKESLDVYDIAIPKEVLFDILEGKRLIFCENTDAVYYNVLNIPDTIFLGKSNSADVFSIVKRDTRGQSLRDRDFLSDSEIDKLKELYPNHHILRYYSFENYLYHPNNLDELNLKEFVRVEYVNEITEQKNNKLRRILPSLDTSRQHYDEFKTNDKIKDKNSDSIADDLSSDDFETFYKYFSMKKWFMAESIARFNLTKEKLVSTQWFKQKIEDVLNS